MANLSNRMIRYEAPKGFVYDFKNIENDNHLYVKFLFLTRNDSIDNYILVKDPKGEG